MKKLIIGGVVAVIVVVIGLTVAFLSQKAANEAPVAPGTEAVDLTSKPTVNIAMRDLSFVPANLKIKKGTTIVWTNEDNVAHNVVEDQVDPNASPGNRATFGKGQTFTLQLFNTGVFHYHCTPHPFMKLRIEVVD